MVKLFISTIHETTASKGSWHIVQSAFDISIIMNDSVQGIYGFLLAQALLLNNVRPGLFQSLYDGVHLGGKGHVAFATASGPI